MKWRRCVTVPVARTIDDVEADVANLLARLKAEAALLSLDGYSRTTTQEPST